MDDAELIRCMCQGARLSPEKKSNRDNMRAALDVVRSFADQPASDAVERLEWEAFVKGFELAANNPSVGYVAAYLHAYKRNPPKNTPPGVGSGDAAHGNTAARTTSPEHDFKSLCDELAGLLRKASSLMIWVHSKLHDRPPRIEELLHNHESLHDTTFDISKALAKYEAMKGGR